MKKLLLILIFLISIQTALALGIAPAEKITLNTQETYNLKIINPEQTIKQIEIEIPEKYKPYINAPNQITITQDQIIQITLNIPQELLSQGENKIPIKITNIQDSNTQLSIQTSIIHDLTIIKPYAQDFLVTKILTSNFEENKQGQITINTQNIGSQTANTTTKVTAANNQETFEFTKENQINPLEEININFPLKVTKKGEYQIIANTKTSTQNITQTKSIKVGKPEFEIKNLKQKNYPQNQIIKLDFEIENDWTNQITAIIETKIENTENQNQITLNSKTNQITIYKDLTNLQKGTYNLEITLIHENQKTTKNFEITLGENKNIQNTLFIIMLLLSITLITILIILKLRK